MSLPGLRPWWIHPMKDKIEFSEAIAAPDPPQANAPRRILVVDDENDVRLRTMDMLLNAGFEVAGAEDGAAGWETLQAGTFDLVITDNQMPKMTGVEMIEKLRSAALKTLVIMATGNLPVFRFARQPWLCPDAVLERPYSNADLLAMVNKVLRRDDGYNAHMKMLLPIYL